MDSAAVVELTAPGVVCLPGDPVLRVPAGAAVSLAGGLRPVRRGGGGEALVLAEQAAATRKRTRGAVAAYALPSPAARRYTPAVGEPVVAVVVRRVGGSGYYMHIGAAAPAYLDALAFDGATKASRPRLAEGDVVYCHVRAPARGNALDGTAGAGGRRHPLRAEDEVALSCAAAEVGLEPRDWTTGEAAFGPLAGGRLLTVPVPYARALAGAPGAEDEGGAAAAGGVLEALGRRTRYDVCVGMNGVVWVRGRASAADPSAAAHRTVAVCGCITDCLYADTAAEVEQHVESYFPSGARRARAGDADPTGGADQNEEE